MAEASTIRPLNGEKTHPLKPGSIEVLGRLARGPVARHEINPGVRDRLSREGLAEETSVAGKPFYIITDAGRAAMKKTAEKAR